MDFHPGGDLLTVMERQEGGMAEENAKFYLTEIAMGLNDLHQLGYVVCVCAVEVDVCVYHRAILSKLQVVLFKRG